MKSRLLAAVVAAASLMGLAGCAGMTDREAIGTAGGAVLGGVVGDAVGGPGTTILGAGAGAYLGNQAAKRTAK